MRTAAAAALALGCAAWAEQTPISYPHPVITEVLYDVPSAALGGDVNQDGARNALGDEFVELYNPHDRPIDLGGYTVSDTHPVERYLMIFTVPEGSRLEPGQCMVIFNGYRQTERMPGPHGDLRTLVTEPNEHFSGAIVYSLKNISGSRAYTDDGDVCVLRAPDGTVVDLIEWGSPRGPVPEDAMRRELVPTDVAFSFQRVGPWGAMLAHLDIDGRRFSPGEVPTEITGGAAPATPTADEPVLPPAAPPIGDK